MQAVELQRCAASQFPPRAFPDRNPHTRRKTLKQLRRRLGGEECPTIGKTFQVKIDAYGVKRSFAKHLTTYYSANRGTSNLRRHQARYDAEMSRVGRSSSSTMSHTTSPFKYDEARNQREFAFYCLATEQPFGFIEDPRFVHCMRAALQPLFRPIWRTTSTRNCKSL